LQDQLKQKEVRSALTAYIESILKPASIEKNISDAKPEAKPETKSETKSKEG